MRKNIQLNYQLRIIKKYKMASDKSLLKLGRFRFHVAYGNDNNILSYHVSHRKRPSIGPKIHDRIWATRFDPGYSNDVQVGDVTHGRNLSSSMHDFNGIDVELRWTRYDTVLQIHSPKNSKRDDAYKLLRKILS